MEADIIQLSHFISYIFIMIQEKTNTDQTWKSTNGKTNTTKSVDWDVIVSIQFVNLIDNNTIELKKIVNDDENIMLYLPLVQVLSLLFSNFKGTGRFI